MLTDTHCHLNLPEFNTDLNQVIRSAKENGVEKILVPGIDLQTSRRAVEISKQHPGLVFAAVGIHPNYSTENDESFLEKFELLLTDPAVVAVGEIGLDFYREYSPKPVQINTFNLMLNLAEKYNKPICVHHRECDEVILSILDQWYAGLVISKSDLLNRAGVFHSYGGSETIYQWANSHQFYYGISGFVTYKKADLLREKLLDLETKKLLIETDAPYLTPVPHRGKRNEPAHVKFITEEISRVLGINNSIFSDISTLNSETLFEW